MFGSAVVYAGLVIFAGGVFLTAKPIPRLGVASRVQAAAIAGAGAALVIIGFLLPANETRARSAAAGEPRSQLDEWTPAWQFSERHSRRVAAPPARVIDAIRTVRASEISLFRALTWIRRGGRDLPPGILNAGDSASILHIATTNGFVWLADDSVRELIVGTVIAAPRGAGRELTPKLFKDTLPPGFTLATMNFLVVPDGASGSIVSTETRVHANTASARRRFAAYWRVIYPGSALIRRMWLRAIDKRATRAPA